MMKNYMKKVLAITLAALPFGVWAQTVQLPAGDNICALSSLDLTKSTCLSGETVRANKSTANNPITLKGTVYASGVGTHAPSVMVVDVNGATKFKAILGIDDEADSQGTTNKANHGIADYEIRKHVDGNKAGEVVKSGTISRDDAAAVEIDLDVTGWDYITLETTIGADGKAWADHVDWANAYFEYSGELPVTVEADEMYYDPADEVALPTEGADGATIIPLSSLDLTNVVNGWGTVNKDKSIDGNRIKLNGTVYQSGIGAHATGKIVVKLNGAVTRFQTYVGIDDEVKNKASNTVAICDYSVTLRDESGDTDIVSEGTVRAGQEPAFVEINDLEGWKYLIIDFPEGAGGNASDHFDLANAYFEYVEQNSTPPAIVPADDLLASLACATTVFSMPGVRFMQRLKTASSEAQVTAVTGLPEGLTWNQERSLIDGIVETEGKYTYTVTTSNGEESADETITLTVSRDLQQPVPFMGWLSWNVFENAISDDKVRAVADAFHSYGLVDAGYKYLCLDDLWHADAREAGTNKPLCSSTKFPHGLKDLADYVHSKGLKFGVYSDAAGSTCAGAFGSYGYEEIDANQYAEWGFDLLKYDYCGAPGSVEAAQTRYKAMGDALKNSGRNILFYMCEWGVREPWKWGAETGATTWRCTYDTRDCWIGRQQGIGVIQSIEGMKDIWAYSGVNRFNDADMMCIGLHGKGKSSNDLCQTGPGMTMTEYQTQFSLWCMWTSPLTLSFDVRNISDEDLAIITNEEMIAINQDRMGQQAEFIGEKDGIQVYAKDLENGDVALAILNLNDAAKTATVNFADISALSVEKEYNMRDLWTKTDLAKVSNGTYTANVKSHETKVYRLSDANPSVKIADLKAAADKIKATADNGVVTVNCNGTKGLTKRILVSDMTGRVVAANGGEGEQFTLPMNTGKGVYVVNVVCAGHSQNFKLSL